MRMLCRPSIAEYDGPISKLPPTGLRVGPVSGEKNGVHCLKMKIVYC
jgi:hypothetical protein